MEKNGALEVGMWREGGRDLGRWRLRMRDCISLGDKGGGWKIAESM